MSRFFAEQPNPLDIVMGECAEYPCSTIEAVDAHLAEIGRRIKLAPPKMAPLLAKYHADQDKLLDRRLYLEMTTPRSCA